MRVVLVYGSGMIVPLVERVPSLGLLPAVGENRWVGCIHQGWLCAWLLALCGVITQALLSASVLISENLDKS